MIERAALDNEAADAAAYRQQRQRVANEIRAMQQFQAKGGTFSRALFEQAMQQNNFTEAAFENACATTSARSSCWHPRSMRSLCRPGWRVCCSTTSIRRATVEYIVLTPEMAGNVPRADRGRSGRLSQGERAKFSTPEYRELEYVAIGPDRSTDKIQVSDADLKKEYEAAQGHLRKARSSATIEQINFPSEAGRRCGPEEDR